jgi:nucleoside-diphosphate-sugar epimerase
LGTKKFGHLNSYSPDLARKIAGKIDGQKILMTGGLGVVGLNTINYIELLRREYGVEADLTIMSKSQDSVGIYSFFGNRNQLIFGDLTSMSTLESLPRFDFVIHGAGYGQPAKFSSNPMTTLLLNTMSTAFLRQKANAGFLFLSSSEVYSGLDSDGIKEEQIGTSTPSHPRAMYIEGKRGGEAMTLVKQEGVESLGTVARLALAYGPGVRLDDQRVLNQLIIRGIYGAKVSIQDHGLKLRTYCYVEDAVEQILGALFLGQGGIYNVGGHSVVTIKQLAQAIATELQVEFEAPNSNATEDFSPDNVNLDLRKITEVTGKRDFVGLTVGLSKTVEWYKELIKGKF